MLVCKPAFPTVGCATLKSMSKLSYTIMEGGKCLFLFAALLVSELIMLQVVWVETNTMCARSSITPGVHFESRKNPMMHCNTLKCSFELWTMITIITTFFYMSG